MFDVGSPIMQFFDFTRTFLNTLPTDIMSIFGALFAVMVTCVLLAFLKGSL